MLAHVTGGLNNLYEIVKQTKKEGADEIKTPYHESEHYKVELQEDSVETVKTKNGFAGNEECGEDGDKNKSEEGANKEDDTLQENSDKEKDCGEGKNAEDKKEKNSQNEKKDDEGGGDDKKKMEEDEEEEGKDLFLKNEEDDLDEEEGKKIF